MTVEGIAVFREAANEFISTLDEFPSRAAVKELRRALVAVYAAALALPEPGATTDSTPEARPTSMPWELVKRVQGALGEDDVFAFDATEPSTEDPYESSLGMELGEIYKDLKESVTLLRVHGPTPDCLWELTFDFEQHWGLHAMHVLPALHQLAQRRD